MNTSRKTLVLVALLAMTLLGAFIGFNILARPQEHGFSVGAPPEPATRIAAATTLDVLVETTGGTFYKCAFGLNNSNPGQNCWTRNNAPVYPVTNSVNHPSVDEGWFVPPPAKTRDYWIATLYDKSRSITEVRYAVLDDGRVWVWSFKTSDSFNFSPTLEGVLAGFFGFACTVPLALAIWGILAVTVWRAKPVSS